MFKIIENKLEKEFICKDFIEGLEFIKEVWQLAEKHNHHPDILLYDYKRVRITLFTHSSNEVTQKDYDLAKEIEKLTFKK